MIPSIQLHYRAMWFPRSYRAPRSHILPIASCLAEMEPEVLSPSIKSVLFYEKNNGPRSVACCEWHRIKCEFSAGWTEICLLYSLQVFNQGTTAPKSWWAPGNWCLKFSNAHLVFVTDKSHCHCQSGLCTGSWAGAKGVQGQWPHWRTPTAPERAEWDRSGDSERGQQKAQRCPENPAVTQQVGGQCRNPSQQCKVKNSEHRAPAQLRIRRGEATNNASPRSCPRLHQVRADPHRSSWAPREEAKWLQSPSVLSGPQQ